MPRAPSPPETDKLLQASAGPPEMTIDLAEVLKIAERREMLCRNAKPCPACGTDQVQLTEYIEVPAGWKCRLCKHRFRHEPRPRQQP